MKKIISVLLTALVTTTFSTQSMASDEEAPAPNRTTNMLDLLNKVLLPLFKELNNSALISLTLVNKRLSDLAYAVLLENGAL